MWDAVLAAGRWPLAAGRWPLAAGRWPLAAGRWPLAAGRWPLAAGRWPLAAGRWPLAAGRWPLAAGRWPLAAGRWPLAAGRWPLAAGRWPLAAGRWPLAAGRCRWPLAAGRWPLAAGRWPLAAGRWPLAAGRIIHAPVGGRCQAPICKPGQNAGAGRQKPLHHHSRYPPVAADDLLPDTRNIARSPSTIVRACPDDLLSAFPDRTRRWVLKPVQGTIQGRSLPQAVIERHPFSCSTYVITEFIPIHNVNFSDKAVSCEADGLGSESPGLLSRTRRRCAGRPGPETFVLGGLAVDYEERRVTVDERPVGLTATEC